MSPEALPGGPAQRRGEGIAKGQTTSRPRTTTKRRQPGGELGWKKHKSPGGWSLPRTSQPTQRPPQWPFHPKGTNPEGVGPSRREPSRRSREWTLPLRVCSPPSARRPERDGFVSRDFPKTTEDLTIVWRRQILQSEAESQRIAVRKLLNRLQHPGWYVSRLQTIRCGYTACGSYGHLGGRRRLYPTPPRSPCMG